MPTAVGCIIDSSLLLFPLSLPRAPDLCLTRGMARIAAAACCAPARALEVAGCARPPVQPAGQVRTSGPANVMCAGVFEVTNPYVVGSLTILRASIKRV